MLAVVDECQDFGDRGIFACKRLHSCEPFGEHVCAKKQLLIERANGGEPFAGELAPPHADNVEALQDGILAVDKPERDDIAAHAANYALKVEAPAPKTPRRPSRNPPAGAAKKTAAKRSRYLIIWTGFG